VIRKYSIRFEIWWEFGHLSFAKLESAPSVWMPSLGTLPFLALSAQQRAANGSK